MYVYVFIYYLNMCVPLSSSSLSLPLESFPHLVPFSSQKAKKMMMAPESMTDSMTTPMITLEGGAGHDTTMMSEKADMAAMMEKGEMKEGGKEAPPPADAGHGAHGVSADVCVLG